MPPFVILDRDGVINCDRTDYVKHPSEWQPIPGSAAAIAQLCQAGIHVFVATNQAGIGRGLYDEQQLMAIHQTMQQYLARFGGGVKDIVFCPHHPQANCPCRKPKPGLLQQLATKHQFALDGVPYVGDSLRDLQAGRQVGCQPVLVLTGHGQSTLNRQLTHTVSDTLVFANLADFVAYYLANLKNP